MHPEDDNTFMCYPILLRKFDPANGEMMSDFLINATPFAESPYDYLILLLANDTGDVIPNALKFPKRGFQCYKLREGRRDGSSSFPISYRGNSKDVGVL